jgi:hypothetical protein
VWQGQGLQNALQVIGGLRRGRLSFSLCLAGFSVGGDTLDGDTVSAANAKQVPACRKDGINISLGLVTFARRPQALAIDRFKARH